MTIFLVCMTAFVVSVTLLPLSHTKHWVVRGWDFPRLQLVIVTFILLLLQIYALKLRGVLFWCLFIPTLSCALWQLWWILPYTRIWKKEVKHAECQAGHHEISLMTSNVLMANKNVQALLNLVHEHKPDILVTLETNKWWEEQLSVLEDVYIYSVKCPLENRYGMHVYSRLPLQDETIQFLIDENVPSIHAQLVLNNAHKLALHFLHPTPPSPTESTTSKDRELELITVAKSVANARTPVIVTGDLNDVAWSSTTRLFRAISGLLDPRIGRGMFNTFHAQYWFIRWPLDHIFHSRHFQLKDIRRLTSIGSDHFPLLARLVYTPDQKQPSNNLEPDENDLKESESLLNSKMVYINAN